MNTDDDTGDLDGRDLGSTEAVAERDTISASERALLAKTSWSTAELIDLPFLARRLAERIGGEP